MAPGQDISEMNGHEEWRGAVEMVRRVTTARGRAGSGYFSIEGVRLHERALRAGQQVETAVLSSSLDAEKAPRIQALLADLRSSGCRLVTVPDQIIIELTGGRDLGLIIGLIRQPAALALSEVITAERGWAPLLLVAVDVKDPGNTGALVRTALAGGATAFIATGISDPYHPKAVRTSMGSLFKLPVITYGQTEDLLRDLVGLGIECAGLAVEGHVPLPSTDFGMGGVAVLVGNEAWGLSPEIRERVDYLVSIPMRDGIDSYSVNAAAAIVLYEIDRRRSAE